MKASHYPRKDSKYLWIQWTDPETGLTRSESTKKLVRPNGEITPCLKGTREGEKTAKLIAQEVTSAYTLGINKNYFEPLSKYIYKLSEAYKKYLFEKTDHVYNDTPFSDRMKRRKTKKRTKLSKSSIELCNKAVEKLIDCCGDKLLGDYREKDFENLEIYYDQYEFYRGKTLKIGLSPNTQAINSRHLRAIFEWFLEQGWIDENPAYVIEARPSDTEPINPLHLPLIFETAANHYPHLFEFCFVLLTSAMRPGEALRIDLSKIDFDNNVIWLDNEKGKKWNQAIPLISTLKDFIYAKYNGNIPASGLLLNHYDSYLGVTSSWKKLINKCNELNGTNMWYRPKQFRSTFSTMMNDSNIPLSKTQKVLRHTDEKTTKDHYTRLNAQEIGEQINKLVNFNSAIFGKKSFKIPSEIISNN
ncbi:MAG: site-specific integrase [Bacteroidetes bacterium]|nr:site-specific integrase [Bacteroidota bacterium]